MPSAPSPPPRPAPGATALLALAVALAALLAFWRLGGELHNHDEARHALVAEGIRATGDWLTLRLDGEPYFNKPPLRFWLGALAMRAFGVSAFAARCWSALFAVVAVALTGLIGRRLYGARAGGWAALSLATTPFFLHVHGARTGETDSTLVALLALAVWCGLRAARRPGAAYLAGLAAGLCGLTKHLAFAPEALVLAVAATLAGGARPRAALAVLLRAGVAAALVALPWHLAMLWRHGEAFTAGYLGREVLERAFGWTGRPRGPHFYLQVLKDGFWPWLPAAVAGGAAALAGLRSGARRATDSLPLLWIALHFVLIASARVKLPWYALPLLPPLALLAGRTIAGWVEAPRGAAERAGLAATVALLLVSPVAWRAWNPSAVPALEGMPRVDLFGLLQGDPGALDGLAPALAGLGVAVLLGGAGAARARRRREALTAPWAAGTGAGVAVAALWLAAAPLRFAGDPPPLAALADRAAGALRPGEPLITAVDPGPGRRDDRLTWLLRRRGLTARRLPVDVPPDSLAAGTLVLADTVAPGSHAASLPGADVLARAGPYVLYRRPPAAAGVAAGAGQ